MGYEELFLFAGGLGMFIYGMQIMSQGLENAAGNKMKSLLEALTKNKIMIILIFCFLYWEQTVVKKANQWYTDTNMETPEKKEAEYEKNYCDRMQRTAGTCH